MKDTLRAVIIAVLSSLIVATAAGVVRLVLEIHELRYDVDRLYAEVSEMAQKE